MLKETQLPSLLYEDEDWRVDIEIVDRKPFLHVHANKWGVGVARKGYQLLFAIKDQLVNAGFTEFYACTQNKEFAEMYGGVYVNSVIYEEKEYGVFKWGL